MQDRWDVAIAGGGVMGASTAWWLATMEPEARIVVLEPDPTYARAATALSVASIRSQFSNPVNVLISRFGIEFIRDFAARLGPAGEIPSLGLRENGYLFLSGSETGAAVMEELATMQRSLGAATEVWDRATLSRRFPWMETGDIAAASFGPRDEGWFDNMGLLSGFRNASRALGVTFHRDRAVSVRHTEGQVTGLSLASGATVDAKQTVLAAGTGVTPLIATLGADWPVEPRKRTVFVIDTPDARHADAPLIIDHSGIYLRPEQTGWITATVPDDDGPCALDDFDPAHDQFDELIWPRLYARSTGFGALKVVRSWVGHYDFNRLDQNAILGAHPDWPGLYLASGFSGHGLQQAPAVGRGLAEVILTGNWKTLDLSDLGVDRVLAGKPFLERAIV